MITVADILASRYPQMNTPDVPLNGRPYMRNVQMPQRAAVPAPVFAPPPAAQMPAKRPVAATAPRQRPDMNKRPSVVDMLAQRQPTVDPRQAGKMAGGAQGGVAAAMAGRRGRRASVL